MVSNLDGARDRGQKQTDVIIMDFADKAPHRRLLYKLDHNGILTSGSARGSLSALKKWCWIVKPQIQSRSYQGFLKVWS